MKSIWFACGMMWFSVGLAIAVGIYFTHSIHCLWFLIIPMMQEFSSKPSGSNHTSNSENNQTSI